VHNPTLPIIVIKKINNMIGRIAFGSRMKDVKINLIAFFDPRGIDAPSIVTRQNSGYQSYSH